MFQIKLEDDTSLTNTKVHLVVDAHGFPLGVTVKEGTVADCKEFRNLLDEVD